MWYDLDTTGFHGNQYSFIFIALSWPFVLSNSFMSTSSYKGIIHHLPPVSLWMTTDKILLKLNIELSSFLAVLVLVHVNSPYIFWMLDWSSLFSQVNTQAPSNITDCSDCNNSKYYIVVVQVSRFPIIHITAYHFIWFTNYLTRQHLFYCSTLLDSMLKLLKTICMLSMMAR